MRKSILATYLVFDLRYLYILFLIMLSIDLPAQDTLTIERLDFSFVSYSDGQFTPLTSLENSSVAGLFIACSEETQYEFCGIRSFEIWLDGQLIMDNDGQPCVYIQGKKLCKYTDKETAYLSIVSKDGLEGIRARTITIAEGSFGTNVLLVRNHQYDHWIIGFLSMTLLLMTIRLVRNEGTWSFQRPNLREYTRRFLTFESLIHLVLLSVISAFCYTFILNESQFPFVFYMSGIILLFCAGKVLLTLLSASIFKCWKWANWQLVVELRYWFVVTIALFFSLLIDFMVSPEIKVDGGMLFRLLAMGTLILLAGVSFVLMSQNGLKKLHIFIYLCTTEILPIILLVYWFLK